jgi:hypothetical protein
MAPYEGATCDAPREQWSRERAPPESPGVPGGWLPMTPDRATTGSGSVATATPPIPADVVSDADPRDSGGPEPTPASSARNWPRWLGRPIAIFVASRVITVASLAVATTISHRSILWEINLWDSKWFIRAAEYGWPSHLPHTNGHVAGNTIAFFPLFPLLIRWLSHLTGLSLLASGIIVTSVTGLTAMIGVWMLVRHYAGQAAADRATLLVALFPGSFVLSMVYSEGVVITCVAFGLLALLQRRWVLAGLLGLLATATSPIALAFEVSCLWCAYRAITTDRNWRALAAPILAPIGFIAYQIWLWAHTGNLLAWRLTERGGWNSYPSLAWPIHLVIDFVRDPIATNKQEDLLVVGIVVTVIAAWVAIRRRPPMPLLLYGLTAAFLALIAAPVGLRPRFIFLAFPLLIAVGTWLRGRSYVVVLSVSTVLLCALTAFTVCSFQIFP